jgi:catechol 2,3-dioxygenase-like lactoylglutathione lyase family enzyme
MFTHIMVGSNDLEKAAAFYDAALGALGHKNLMPAGAARLAYRGPHGAFLVGAPANGAAATHANGGTIGFAAKDRAEVDAFHAAGLANGGTDDGAPGIRMGTGRPMYGAYLRDADGNKICAFTPG